MDEKKFDPKKLYKLNNPQRLLDIPSGLIREKLSFAKDEIAVEIGAGTAFFSIAFWQELQPATMYACDMAPAMIEWIMENVVPRYPNIIPVKSEENSVPLPDGVANLVFMIALHHELAAPSLMLVEAFRLLKPGGEIFIVDWKKQDMSEGPPTRIRCRPEQVATQLKTAGFERIRVYNDMPKHFLLVGKKQPMAEEE